MLLGESCNFGIIFFSRSYVGIGELYFPFMQEQKKNKKPQLWGALAARQSTDLLLMPGFRRAWMRGMRGQKSSICFLISWQTSRHPGMSLKLQSIEWIKLQHGESLVLAMNNNKKTATKQREEGWGYSRRHANSCKQHFLTGCFQISAFDHIRLISDRLNTL